jgi:Flp pilus assembly protein TadG
VAPVFFLLVIGIIEVGRAMMVQQVIINAARVGARHAVTLSATLQSTVDTATEYAKNVGVNGLAVTVSPDPATADASDEITVTTTIDFASVTWVPSPWFMGGKILTASSVMRKEGF